MTAMGPDGGFPDFEDDFPDDCFDGLAAGFQKGVRSLLNQGLIRRPGKVYRFFHPIKTRHLDAWLNVEGK